jgi:HAD superfamily hydrolase (TIGR01490 family)
VTEPLRAAFYDLDGTLISGNVVTRYAFFARRRPWGVWQYTKLLLSVPLLLGMDLYSRRAFNKYFYRSYRGLRREWLESLSDDLFERVIRPEIYPSAKSLVEADRQQGYRVVLVSGALDFDLPALVRYFRFDGVLCNRLVFQNGAATGEVVAPLLAEDSKRQALLAWCRQYNVDLAQSKAYSDSLSDLPMLEAVGQPAVVHPERRLRQIAAARGWPILDLKKGNDGHRS